MYQGYCVFLDWLYGAAAGEGEVSNETRTRLLHVFVYDHQIGEPSPGCPSRYLSHLKSPSFRSSVEFGARENPDEFIAKLIGRARRLWRCRDEYFWWDRRIVGG